MTENKRREERKQEPGKWARKVATVGRWCVGSGESYGIIRLKNENEKESPKNFMDQFVGQEKKRMTKFAFFQISVELVLEGEFFWRKLPKRDSQLFFQSQFQNIQNKIKISHKKPLNHQLLRAKAPSFRGKKKKKNEPLSLQNRNGFFKWKSEFEFCSQMRTKGSWSRWLERFFVLN